MSDLLSGPLASLAEPAFAATLMLATYLTAEANTARALDNKPKYNALMVVVNELNKSLNPVRQWYQNAASGPVELKAAREILVSELLKHQFSGCEQMLEHARVCPEFLDQPKGLLSVIQKHALGQEGAIGPVWIGRQQGDLEDFLSKFKMLCRRWRNRS